MSNTPTATLYIRGVSIPVSRKFRMGAAERGMTHGEYLTWLVEASNR